MVLLVASQGWNASVLDVMRLPSYDPAEACDQVTIFPVEVVKPRRPVSHRYSSENLVDTGAGSAGRLMRQAIEATAPARDAMSRESAAHPDWLTRGRPTHAAGEPTKNPAYGDGASAP